jgi:hypothetical protein
LWALSFGFALYTLSSKLPSCHGGHSP